MANPGGIRAGRAFVELGVSDKLTAGLKRAQRRLRAFGQGVRSLGMRLAGLAAGVGAGFAVATRIFAGFDDRMRVVRAVTGATEKQFQSLTGEAKRLGRTTSFTAGQVAEAMTELGRAGFKPQAILDSTQAVLALARSTSTELPRASEIAGAAMRAFNLPATEMVRVSDVLTATANKSAQTLDDLAEALKPVSPIAVEAGASLEDTAAAVGILANNGIKGSLAGNALARAYKNLANESRQAELRKIGVEAVDAAGNLRPLAAIINDLAKATQGLGSAQKLSIFETLFGRGQAAALKLASSGKAFDVLQDEIKRSGGLAQQTAAEMDAGIGGSFRRLLSAVEGIAIAIGEAIEGPVRVAADVLAKIAGWITTVVGRNRELVATIAKVTAIVFAVGAALVVAGTAIVGIGAVIGGLATIFSGLGAAIGIVLGLLGTLLSPIGLVMAAVVGLGGAVIHYTGASGAAIAWLKGKFEALRGIVEQVAGGIVDALAAGDIALAGRVLMAGLHVAWQQGTDAIERKWIKFTAGFQKIAIKAFAGVKKAWLHVSNWFWKNFPETTAFMSKTWARFTSGLQKLWARAQNWLSDRFLDLMGLFDETLDVEAAQQLGRDQLNQQVASIDSERDAAIAEAERRANRTDAQREAEHAQDLADVDQARADALASLDERTQRRLDAATQELADANAALAQARAQAAQRRAEAEAAAAEQDDDGPDFSGVGNELANQLAGALDGVDAAVAKGVTVRGTFNAAAIQGLMGAGDAQTRTATATEQTARNTKRLVDAARNGGLAFT